MEPLLTLEQVAEYLGGSRDNIEPVQELIENGYIKGLNFPEGRILVPLSSVIAYLEQLTAGIIQPDTEEKVQEEEVKEATPTRPSWDTYFMSIAEAISTRHTCDRLAVGCVLVKDNHIIAQGYNGSISGHEHCDERGHLLHEGSCKLAIHAEMNAILMCAKLGIATTDAVAYVTHYPCAECMKHLNQAGIRTVYFKHYYAHKYDNPFTKNMTLIQLA